jgi:polyisoprenoid-binding protein YceI
VSEGWGRPCISNADAQPGFSRPHRSAGAESADETSRRARLRAARHHGDRCRCDGLPVRPGPQLRALRGAAFRHLDAARPLRPAARRGLAGRGRVALRIPVGSLSTGLALLDRRLRDSDLLAAGAYPDAYFVAERFVFEAGALREVRGEFTLRGVGRPLALRAQRFGCRPHPESRREGCGGDFEAELRRSDFGITFGLPLVADRVRLLIQVEALRME